MSPFSSTLQPLALRFAIALLCLGIVGCKPNKTNPNVITAPPVEATQVRTGSLPLIERLSGTVWAENQVVLYPELSGRIAEVFVDNGKTVTAGQSLVSLYDEVASEQVRQAEAGLRIEEARLRQSRAALAEVQAQANRIQSLSDRNLVTEVELETNLAQRESAAADVELAQARVEQAASNLAERRSALAKMIVKAPVAGIVGVRNAEIGMQVTAATPLFTIGNLDRVTVRIDLTDSMLAYVKIGQTVQIYAPDDETQPLAGKLTRISPFLNPVARSTEAEIELNNSARRLQPGMFVPVDILYGESRQATLIPTSALYTDSNTGREGVFILKEPPPAGPDSGSELSAPVPVGFSPIDAIARGASEVAINDLPPGTWIVTLGQNLLATGRTEARVRSVTWEQVLELQNLQREDLLDEIIQPKPSGRE